MYLLFTVLLHGWHVGTIYVWYRQTTQQVCINYLLYCYPGGMSGPFMCGTDRRHSMFVFTIYCIVYPVGKSGPFMCVTDRRHSTYVLTIYCTVTRVASRDHLCVYRQMTQQVCIYYLLYCYPGDMPGLFICVTDRRHSKYVLTIYCIVTWVACLNHLCVV